MYFVNVLEARNNETEEFYDSPALGSPRAVPPARSSPTGHIQVNTTLKTCSYAAFGTDDKIYHATNNAKLCVSMFVTVTEFDESSFLFPKFTQETYTGKTAEFN